MVDDDDDGGTRPLVELPHINGTMYAAQCMLHSESEGEEDIYKILDYSRENDDSLMYSPTCPYKTSTL